MSVLNFLEGLFFKRGRGLHVKTSSLLVRDMWQEVEDLSKSDNPSSLKQAVIKADKILELIIKDATGAETLGQGLKLSRSLFSKDPVYQMAWDAHKVRNAMVHDVNYDPPSHVSSDALRKFENVFKDLSLI